MINARASFAPLRRADAKILLAAVPQPEKWSPIFHVIDEVAGIRGVVPPGALLTNSTGVDVLTPRSRGASVQSLLDDLPRASLVHLACHGHQARGSPLDSGFVMADGMLTVSRLMALNLAHAFLAFLSACESAKGDERQPDQAIHLAATMLFAEFKSVVATMW